MTVPEPLDPANRLGEQLDGRCGNGRTHLPASFTSATTCPSTALALVAAEYHPVVTYPRGFKLPDRDEPSDGKRPMGKGWGLDAPTVQTIRERYQRHPAAGVGIALGPRKAPGGHWLVDLEVDGEEGEASLLALFGGESVDTLAWSSRRGRHRLYLADPERIAPLVAAGEGKGQNSGVIHHPELPGLELRLGREGCQIQSVCPPTVGMDDQPRRWEGPEHIAWLPAVVYENLGRLLSYQREEPSNDRSALGVQDPSSGNGGLPFSAPTGTSADEAWFREGLRREAEKVAQATDGTRHKTLLTAARTLGGSLHHGYVSRAEVEAALTDAGRRCGLPEAEVSEVIRDGLKYGTDAPLPLPERLERPKRREAGVPKDAPWPPLKLSEPPAIEPAPVAVLPPALAAYCRAVAEATRTPPDFALAALLTVAGAAVGQSVNLRINRNWTEAPLLYTVLVAPPGKRKSPVIRAVRRPLFEIDMRLRQQSKEARERWEEAKKKHTKDPDNNAPPGPEPPQLRAVVDDITRASLTIVLADNPRGTLADPKEAAAWMNSFDEFTGGRGRDRQFWMCVYDCEAVYSDRKGGWEQTFVPHPYCAVIASTQPEMLGALNGDRGRADGFYERLTLIAPDPASYPSQFWTEAEVPAEVEAVWRDCIVLLHSAEMVTDELHEIRRPWYVELTMRGKTAWVAWHDVHVAEMEAAEFDPALAGVWSKAIGRCARLALILSRLRWALVPPAVRPATPLDVTEHDVEGAAKLTRWLCSHAARVAHERSGGVTDSGARDVLDWLRRHHRQSFRRAEVSEDLRRFRREAKLLVEALESLENAGVIRRRAETPDPHRTGPRPTPLYDVHPALLEAPEDADIPSTTRANGGNDGNFGRSEDEPSEVVESVGGGSDEEEGQWEG